MNTLPQPTLAAFRDHGTVQRTLDEGLDEARATLAALAKAGIERKREALRREVGSAA